MKKSVLSSCKYVRSRNNFILMIHVPLSHETVTGDEKRGKPHEMDEAPPSAALRSRALRLRYV
jgi:hypothetical protein